MRRLLQYSRICEQLRLNICGKSALRSKFMGQYGFAQDSVGADAHIGSRSMCRFTEIFGELVTSKWVNVGIDPYNQAGKCIRI